MENLAEVKSLLDNILSNADLSSTTSEGVKSSDLPDGYYLSEVEKAELTSSKAGNPMVSFQFKVVENGLKSEIDELGNDTLTLVPGSINRKIWMNYVITTEQNLGFFVSDMLKFEDPEEPGKPLLADTPEEAKAFFKTSDLFIEALDIIAEMGSRIYIMVQSRAKKDNPNEMEKRYSLISWKRAKGLELPM